MLTSLLTKLFRLLRATLQRISNFSGGRGEAFLDFRKIAKSASQVGLTPLTFVWNSKPLERQLVPARVLQEALKFLDTPPRREVSILEIGPGTGRFLAESIANFEKIEKYAIVESDSGWANYCSELIKSSAPNCLRLPVVNAKADLTAIEQYRFDLIQAHAVFVQLPATLTFTFLERMAPLLKPDGVMVFDVFSAPTLAKLKEHSEASWATYYHPSWLIDHLAVFGLEVQRRLSQPYGIAGSSEYWFVKRQTSPAPV